MATYVSLIDFTEQGLRHLEQSPQRARAFTAMAQELGVTTRQVFWTLGGHDGVLIFDADDDEAATAAMVNLARQGNVKPQTLRAFTESEFTTILERRSQ